MPIITSRSERPVTLFDAEPIAANGSVETTLHFAKPPADLSLYWRTDGSGTLRVRVFAVVNGKEWELVNSTSEDQVWSVNQVWSQLRIQADNEDGITAIPGFDLEAQVRY